MSDITGLFLIFMLPMLLWAYTFVLSIVCLFNPGLSMGRKILWSTGIGITGYFFHIGGIIYGFLYFGRAKKIFPVLALAILVVYHCYDWAHQSELGGMEARVSVMGADKAIAASPESPHKQELLNDMATLKQELSSHTLSQEREIVYMELALCAGMITIGGVNENSYKQWQGLYNRRAGLNPEDMLDFMEVHIDDLRNKK